MSAGDKCVLLDPHSFFPAACCNALLAALTPLGRGGGGVRRGSVRQSSGDRGHADSRSPDQHPAPGARATGRGQGGRAERPEPVHERDGHQGPGCPPESRGFYARVRRTKTREAGRGEAYIKPQRTVPCLGDVEDRGECGPSISSLACRRGFRTPTVVRSRRVLALLANPTYPLEALIPSNSWELLLANPMLTLVAVPPPPSLLLRVLPPALPKMSTHLHRGAARYGACGGRDRGEAYPSADHGVLRSV